ncbi:LemA family protein [Calothrix sp. UHCC 0171]|uniref:LemA family protein n=1 Tax=Calothrix sp. UHCC 0171 TaxID=3110245 RepID=UPI002B1FE1FD|nr:LemA family protein [Calothrix sp. UHCC 0171]MEA5572300.1 LemA family protein [Calothrix sp. UHCC 0171]
MKNQEIRIPEEIAPEVLELASRYYANQMRSYSQSDLVAAGEEVDIPPEIIQQAIRDIQKQHQEKIQRQQQTQKQRQILLKITASMFVALSLWSIWTYNSLASSNSKVEAAWAQVENQLQRRADLIPNLVNVTQNYAKHEKELVSLLKRSHSSYLHADTPDKKAGAIVQINQAIDSFRTYAVANPLLQSNQLFINLQYELAGTENRLSVERRRYNQAVQVYNQEIQVFPNSLVANTFGFQKKEFFQPTNTRIPQIPGE